MPEEPLEVQIRDCRILRGFPSSSTASLEYGFPRVLVWI